ncbi:MAG: hypothetical protein KKD39_02750, partial [Candidatus Altiarchaeota archaeon]|nr:hypothetical protein [Candidatus Altiarchaeota archaeon]
TCLSARLYHESTHIFHKGSSLEDAEDALDIKVPGFNQMDAPLRSKLSGVEYLSNPGEMMAHAAEYAYYYSIHHPGMPFNIEKMRETIPLMDKKTQNSATSYYSAMSNPEKQDEYAKYGFDLAKTHQEMIKLTGQYVHLFSGT